MGKTSPKLLTAFSSSLTSQLSNTSSFSFGVLCVPIITANPSLDGLSPKGSKPLLSNGRVVELAPIRRSWAGIHNK
ncbi:hypothetical protein PIB30_071148 [Stylosanthes scabra]|uniref:Uncharacterized protein n=1 Tax=Stylosanthes scabra TaxID=79078 RepID=A0ABU6TNV3_9FABA|nr:hypothetical protein [Stylosanthes scabra]